MSDRLRTIKFLMLALCVLPGMAAASVPAPAGMHPETDMLTIVLIGLGLIAVASCRAAGAAAILPGHRARLKPRNTPS